MVGLDIANATRALVRIADALERIADWVTTPEPEPEPVMVDVPLPDDNPWIPTDDPFVRPEQDQP